MQKPNTKRGKERLSVKDTAERHTRLLCLAAFLTALSFLLGYIAKSIQGTGPVRFTLEGLPIVLAGAVLGPVYGALAGLAADLLSCLLAGQAPIPLIALGAAAVGLVPGVICRILPLPSGKPRFFHLLLLSGGAHLVGSILLKTLGLAMWYPLPLLLWRIPLYLLVILLESTVLSLLLGSFAVRRELERLVRK